MVDGGRKKSERGDSEATNRLWLSAIDYDYLLFEVTCTYMEMAVYCSQL